MIKHLALVMDGNRRWAKRQGLRPWYGHKQGVESVRTVIKFCVEQAISYVSLYTLSIENLRNRSTIEMNYLLDLLVTNAHDQLPFFKEHNVRIVFVGDRSLFPKQTGSAIDELEQETRACDGLQVNLLFCYGARQEILSGIKELTKKLASGQLSADELTEDDLNHYLWTAGIPDPDLIIRTGGAQRLSNFLLYQAAYSEFYFLDALWPELTHDHLQGALDYFNGAQRNFGI